ncbi:MAG: type I restriction enzyme HsdR N-terminal domain-containing protein [Bacteroidales bacterium]|nr:type I restriction enzyme HsdR N-terminal domain-containing protein [Bacteroidales bacterium]MCF8345199.1 type I restriction enzyme HsdR N-terminal domain-containing protein [Bacteroidales bacterium]MCF8352417.1 type I restriction enzyme HsdR N-terminal domain-containing protein [Bacteroidales bacterium]MCF8377139.1 type I restriction enzyme HsdR N-terminal domain-containing protein [Bacteroidales bacterium]MCF8401045.1 type I restriction enzyme HsdR N-terminal domain-containing protein [Bac
MISLNLPKYDFKIRRQGKQFEIFDAIRNKYVAMTPEEWVRQNFLQYLIWEKKFPKTLLSIERQLSLYQMSVRPDIVVYNNLGKPRLIVECKAPDVKISQQTFNQIAKYNITLRVDYLIVTNGINHYCCNIDHQKKSYSFLQEIPLYDKL